MIATGKLHDQITIGVAASQANGRHRRFGAGIDHADFVDARNQVDDELRKLDFKFGGRAKSKRCFGLCLNCGDDGPIAVTQNHRAPGSHIVDVAITIGVGKEHTFATLEKYRRAANAFERADWGIDAARNRSDGACHEFF